MNFIKQKTIPIVPLLLVSLLIECSGSVSAGDTFLFGISERFEQAFGSRETPACSSDVTISTKLVSLVEDGDVNSTFSTVSENGLTDVDTDGGTAWGYRSFQTCIYPNVPFSGSLDIPVSITSNYGTRITSLKTFPAPDVAIPTKLTFTGNGVAVRQCFTFTVAQDAVRSAKVDPMTVALGTMTQKMEVEKRFQELTREKMPAIFPFLLKMMKVLEFEFRIFLESWRNQVLLPLRRMEPFK